MAKPKLVSVGTGAKIKWHWADFKEGETLKIHPPPAAAVLIGNTTLLFLAQILL
jgi:hypothetical protein